MAAPVEQAAAERTSRRCEALPLSPRALGGSRVAAFEGGSERLSAPCVALVGNEGGPVMDKDRIKGKLNDAVGSAKEAVGKATGHKATERSGKADQAEGKVQKGVGAAKDAVRGNK